MELSRTKKFIRSAIEYFAFRNENGDHRLNMEGIVEMGNPSGSTHSFCIAKSEEMDLTTGDFSLDENHPFYICNDGDDDVTLNIRYAKNGVDSDFEEKKIYAGAWVNPDLVIAVEQNAGDYTLRWGY